MNVAAVKYRNMLTLLCEKVGVPKPKLVIDKRSPQEPDLSDWYDSETRTIYVSSPYWKWNLVHEFAHYVMHLDRAGELDILSEENFIEYCVDTLLEV